MAASNCHAFRAEEHSFYLYIYYSFSTAWCQPRFQGPLPNMENWESGNKASMVLFLSYILPLCFFINFAVIYVAVCGLQLRILSRISC